MIIWVIAGLLGLATGLRIGWALVNKQSLVSTAMIVALGSLGAVAALPEVRAALVDFQRAFARRSGGAVLDGRDIGTVICPEAEVKFFVTASDQVRAERRFAELRDSGHAVTLDGVLKDLRERDARDSARAAAPMVPAADAVVLDTSGLAIDAVVAEAIRLVTEKTGCQPAT